MFDWTSGECSCTICIWMPKHNFAGDNFKCIWRNKSILIAIKLYWNVFLGFKLAISHIGSGIASAPNRCKSLPESMTAMLYKAIWIRGNSKVIDSLHSIFFNYMVSNLRPYSHTTFKYFFIRESKKAIFIYMVGGQRLHESYGNNIKTIKSTKVIFLNYIYHQSMFVFYTWLCKASYLVIPMKSDKY